MIEFRAADQGRLGTEFREVMEHQDAAAEAIGSYLEAGPIAGIGIKPYRPALTW